MTKKSTESVAASSPTWETLEAFARHSMQQLLQRMLEEEVDGLLARGRYERRGAVDAAVGYRNGFGKPRRLTLSNGTITLRRPRVRGLVGPEIGASGNRRIGSSDAAMLVDPEEPCRRATSTEGQAA